MKGFLVPSLALISLFLFFSCSGSSPSIDELKWQVLLRDDGENRYEQLMVFARFSDPDSHVDPDLVTVRVDGTGLVWRFRREQWTEDPKGGEWWGLPPMVAQSGFRIPDGRYTLILEDLAGRSAEMQFRPDPRRPGIDDIEWPEVEIVSGTLRLSGDFPMAVLNLRNTEGLMVEAIPAVNGIQIEMEGVDSWELQVPGKNGSGGFLSGPFPSELLHTE